MAPAQNITIHQYHPSAAGWDAITNQMRFIRNTLAQDGIGGEIFASDIKHVPLDEIRPLDVDALWNCDLILFHHSQGHASVKSLLKIETPKALVYHNITPPQFFSSDPYLADLCKQGREQLNWFKDRSVAYFADSQYNLEELDALGMPRGQILPLFDLGDLRKMSKPPKTRAARGPKEIRMVFVGKLLPHKNQVLLLEVVYYLKEFCGLKPKLRLIGGAHPLYRRYLELMIQSLGISDSVELVGSISDAQRDLYYRESDLFLSTSLHEGFGIPLVEAMARGIPVFYLPSGASPETMGKAGVKLLTEKPHEIATILATVLSDPNASNQLQQGQETRLSEISQIQNKARVTELLRAVVLRLRREPHRASMEKGTLHAPPSSPSAS